MTTPQGYSDPTAPYPVGSLHPPLDPATRKTMLDYMGNKMGGGGGVAAALLSVNTELQSTEGYALDTNGNLNKIPIISGVVGGNASDADSKFIHDYEFIAAHVPGGAGAGGGPGQIDTQFAPPSIPGISTATDFLKLLANGNTWIRAAEFAVGGILIAIGVAHLAGGSLSGAAKSVSPIGQATKLVSSSNPAGVGGQSAHTSYTRHTAGKKAGVIKTRSNYQT